jgi:hypothetical protein
MIGKISGGSIFSRVQRGVKVDDAAMKANRFWVARAEKVAEARLPNFWLPRGHKGACQPVS